MERDNISRLWKPINYVLQEKLGYKKPLKRCDLNWVRTFCVVKINIVDLASYNARLQINRKTIYLSIERLLLYLSDDIENNLIERFCLSYVLSKLKQPWKISLCEAKLFPKVVF